MHLYYLRTKKREWFRLLYFCFNLFFLKKVVIINFFACICCRDPAFFSDGWQARIKTDVADNWRLKVGILSLLTSP